jgi:dCMP deaminase
MRPSKDRYFLEIALKVSGRSTCIRRKYGSVIVKGNIIVGTGYNGPAKGVINCDQVGCTKDVLDQPHGGFYEYCTAVHSEENAIINSNRGDRVHSTLYIAGYQGDGTLAEAVPCRHCKRKIINSDISSVIILGENNDIKRFDTRDWVAEDTGWYIQTLKEAKEGVLDST